MNTMKVYLNSINDITRFIQTTNKSAYDLVLVKDKYTVNAKSLLGILSLDLSKPVILEYDKIESSILKELKQHKCNKVTK